jgi:hypothetical protein
MVRTLIKKAHSRHKCQKVAFVLALSIAAAGEVAAQDRRPSQDPRLTHQADKSQTPCRSLDDCDRKDFDESGTRGRMGLGANPMHPEGPGNFSD